jgi:hypothetical protein
MIFVLFCWGLPPKFQISKHNRVKAEMRLAPAMFFALLLVLAPAFAFGASFVVLYRFRPSPRLVQ